MSIFATVAPAYYGAGLSVIPLYQGQKNPIPKGWPAYATAQPSSYEFNTWLQQYPDANIGIIVGPQSGISCFDLDSTDPRVISIIESILPRSPWIRYGNRGYMAAFKYSEQATFNIDYYTGTDAKDRCHVGSFFGSVHNVVLPPSIHPDTQKPYFTENGVDLLSVYHLLPEVPDKLEERIRAALVAAGYGVKEKRGRVRVSDRVAVGERDVTMTRIAGFEARAVIRGELTFLEAVEDMQVWYRTKMAAADDGDISIDKGIGHLSRFVVSDVLRHGKVLPTGWDEGLTDSDRERYALDELSEIHTERSPLQLKEIVAGVFRDSGPDSEEAVQILKEALSNINRAMKAQKNNTGFNKVWTEFTKHEFINWVVNASGRVFTKKSLTLLDKSLTGPSFDMSSHSGIAKAIISDWEGRYGELSSYSDVLMQWNERYWETIDDIVMRQCIADEWGDLDMSRRASDYKGVLTTMKQILDTRSDLFKHPTPGVNFSNGFLNLDGVLEPIVSKDTAVRYVLDYPYDPRAPRNMPLFIKLLEHCWGNDSDYTEKVRALQWALCASLTGIAYKFQKCFFLFGAAQTGKSTLLKIIQALMPRNATSSLSMDKWNQKFAIASMVGAVVNFSHELPDHIPIPGDIFKSIIDGAEQPIERKGINIYFSPIRAAQWASANHLPRSSDTSRGFLRRWIVFGFSNVVKNVDKDLAANIIKTERAAIVAWALDVLPHVNSAGTLPDPPSGQQIVEDMANQIDPVRWFVNSSFEIEIGKGGTMPLFDLYSKFVSFSYRVGSSKVMPLPEFIRRLRICGPDYGITLSDNVTVTKGFANNVMPLKV